MAGGLDGEISKLRHKDVRQRRRAVRVLFDTDLPRALEGFVPLLNDRDPWFRSKALDAHRRWAPLQGPSALKVLAEHSSIEARRCAANLLSEFNEDVSEIALLMIDDEDLTCRRKSASALLDSAQASEYVERFLTSEAPIYGDWRCRARVQHMNTEHWAFETKPNLFVKLRCNR